MQRSRLVRTGLRTVCAIAVLMILLVPVLASGCGGGYSSPEEAVKAMLEARQEGDWASFKDTVLPDRVRELTADEEVSQRQAFEEQNVNFKDLKYKTESDESDKNKASVVITSGVITMMNPMTNQEESLNVDEVPEEGRTFTTQKYKGGWYVDVPLSMGSATEE